MGRLVQALAKRWRALLVQAALLESTPILPDSHPARLVQLENTLDLEHLLVQIVCMAILLIKQGCHLAQSAQLESSILSPRREYASTVCQAHTLAQNQLLVNNVQVESTTPNLLKLPVQHVGLVLSSLLSVTAHPVLLVLWASSSQHRIPRLCARIAKLVCIRHRARCLHAAIAISGSMCPPNGRPSVQNAFFTQA